MTRYLSYDENLENSHYSYHGVFAAKLADEFFYTGGVRDILPTRKNQPKLEPLLGPELTLENLGMNGRLSLHALSRITADGLVNRPDLVLINFGINDAMLGVGLATYLEAIETSVRYIRATGADVILLGPTDMIREDTLAELALPRAYSAALRELAERLGVFYFDLGSTTMLAPGTPPELSPEQALSSITATYREEYYDHDSGDNDGLHPNPEGHELMGSGIFKALRDGTDAEPYRIGGYFTIAPDGSAVLDFKLKNLQDVPAQGQLLLMPAGGMLPDPGKQAVRSGGWEGPDLPREIPLAAREHLRLPGRCPARLRLDDRHRCAAQLLAGLLCANHAARRGMGSGLPGSSRQIVRGEM